MALVIADRVRETSTTTGTGTFTLAGAVTGFTSFANAIGNGNTTYYTIADNNNWEVGVGTVGTGTLSRDTVYASSNSGNKVDFLSGTKDVFVTYPAGRATYLLDDKSFVLSGQVLSNSQSQSLIDFSTIWNTTGTPTAVKLNVTDTASNALSNLIDLQVSTVSKFKVDKSGAITGSQITMTGTNGWSNAASSADVIIANQVFG